MRAVATTGSTNDDAVAAAEAGEPAGLAVWALEQTAGRGRHGRSWHSPPGNLYCSALLRPAAEHKNMGHYGFAAALALHNTIKEMLSSATDISLKWPNDVLANGKKISGLLLEAGPGHLVIGMGLNVRHHPEGGLYPATSLVHEGAQVPELRTILGRLLERLGTWCERLETDGFKSVREAWLSRARGGALTVRLPRETVSGEFRGVDDNGNLRLGLADGSERAIATGDVFFTNG